MQLFIVLSEKQITNDWKDMLNDPSFPFDKDISLDGFIDKCKNDKVIVGGATILINNKPLLFTDNLLPPSDELERFQD